MITINDAVYDRGYEVTLLGKMSSTPGGKSSMIRMGISYDDAGEMFFEFKKDFIDQLIREINHK